jgi:ribosome biogenesis GTPase A
MMLQQPQVLDVVHTDCRNLKSVEGLLDRSIDLVRRSVKQQTYKIFIVGMPNVGKSTLINTFKRITGSTPQRTPNEEQQRFLENYKERYGSLPFTLMDNSIDDITRKKRGAKKQNVFAVAKTGARAGVTRTISQFVISKQNPRILCMDSPGIMIPKLYNSDQALRLAIAGVRQTPSRLSQTDPL